MESNSREVPKVQHNLKNIHEINEGDDSKDAIDFVGVVIDVGEVINFTARSGKELTKREVSFNHSPPRSKFNTSYSLYLRET